MAFDLNKNDGPGKGASPEKKAKAKFNLIKPETGSATNSSPAGDTVNNPPKSKTWLFGMAGVLIVGGGLLYYYGSAGSVSKENNGPVVPVTQAVPVAASAVVDSSKTAEPKGEASVGVQQSVEKEVNVANDPLRTARLENENKATKAQTLSAKTASRTVVPADKKTNIGRLNGKIPATFGQGSTTVNQVNQSLVSRIRDYLLKNPEAAIQVNGYASSDGPLELNQTISQARAEAFKQYLVSKIVDENRITAVGKGIENPVASNDNHAGRKKNRRVEITFP